MSEKTTRNRRIRKKLYLDEFAILGFEFSCKLTADSQADYEQFFNHFAELVDSRHLYITLDNDSEWLEGSVTSADRYGNATDEDREAINTFLSAQAIASEVKVGDLVDAFYAM
ncbi:YggL family protein [Neptunicella sp. SCSIO 80796]|uniref:YggL 50S ribosome-binding family protein n=1 Tax=Neptunicella plasticusilytica TaxID=3117012 RepID=UPI003A4E65AA